jgi:peptide/nickel transport system permease protein
MSQYVLRRLLVAIPSLLIATFIIFALPRLIPGDVVQLMLEDKAYGKDLDDLRARLGLNRPIPEQYVVWLGRIAHGDLGESLWTKRPVVEELTRRVPVSLELGLLALVFAIAVALPVGVLAAARQDTMADYVVRSLAVVGLSVPGFWIATLVLIVPAIWWGWIPRRPFVEISRDPWAHLINLVLPAAILGIASAAAILRLTRATLLEALRQDYVRTAWAKGHRERVVLLKHALKNALVPVVTVLGLQVSALLGGTVIFETIFGLPGMGRFLFDAINQRDYPVIQGVNLLIVAVVVVVNLVVDACYALLDSRIRY